VGRIKLGQHRNKTGLLHPVKDVAHLVRNQVIAADIGASIKHKTDIHITSIVSPSI